MRPRIIDYEAKDLKLELGSNSLSSMDRSICDEFKLRMKPELALKDT